MRPGQPGGRVGRAESDVYRSAEVILTGVVFELRELIMLRGVRSEEMIRASAFFESAKALWIVMVGREPMSLTELTHRLQILVDICPPELRSYRGSLELARQIAGDLQGQQKRA